MPDHNRQTPIRMVHVTAIGTSAKLFLTNHFLHFIKDGFEVFHISADDDHARDCEKTSGVNFIPVPFKQGIAPISDLLCLFRLVMVLLQVRPVIIDSHMSKIGLIGSIAGWLARVPIRIYHNHGMALLSSTGWKHRLLYLVELLACYFATKVIYVSPSNMEDAIKIGVCPEHKATVLGPGTISGVDLEKFDLDKNIANGIQLRHEAGIPDNSWIIGFVARIVPHKGIETLLEAWRILPSDIRSKSYLCIFGVYGHPKLKALVEQAISEPDLHVKYIGFTDDISAWYSTMTLLAQPSWHEGWGYNVLEAACNGVPAVGTRISATVDAIIDGQTGLLVPVKDEHAMAKALAKLLEDDKLRKKYGQAARERTINDFEQGKIIPLLAQEYRRLLG